MMVVDASVMVSILRSSDTFRDQSIQWFSLFLTNGGTLIAPDLLLSEVAGVISRDAGDPTLGREAIAWLRSLPELTLVSSDSSFGIFAAEVAAEFGLRGADAWYVALAIQRELPLVTWDRQQRERSAHRISALRPDQFTDT